MRTRSIVGLTILVTLLGCSALVIDPSVNSVDAGDYTLALTACEAVPGHGMDICRVTAGTKIESSWKLVIPSGKRIIATELDVYYRDIHKTYSGKSSVIDIPWKDFFGAETWSKDQDGQALALLLVRYEDDNGVEQVVKFRGIAMIVVTAPGYSRLPIDSGFSAFKTTCKVQYSTGGRGALECK